MEPDKKIRLKTIRKEDYKEWFSHYFDDCEIIKSELIKREYESLPEGYPEPLKGSTWTIDFTIRLKKAVFINGTNYVYIHRINFEDNEILGCVLGQYLKNVLKEDVYAGLEL